MCGKRYSRILHTMVMIGDQHLPWFGNLYASYLCCLHGRLLQVNGCLSYFDRIPDGFYLIHGMDPYAWTISTDQHDIGLIPSYESLNAVRPGNDLSIKVVLIDKSRDTGLRDIHNRVLSASCNWITAEDVVHHLANLVCNQLG